MGKNRKGLLTDGGQGYGEMAAGSEDPKSLGDTLWCGNSMGSEGKRKIGRRQGLVGFLWVFRSSRAPVSYLEHVWQISVESLSSKVPGLH